MGTISRIVFVCHGNICRSPMAQFVMQALVERCGLVQIEVASRATSQEEIWGGVGNPIYPPAAAELRRHGIAFDADKRAQQLTAEDCRYYDWVVVMDDNNLRNVARMYPFAMPKVRKLLDYCGGGNVADPWYTGRFDVAYRDIERGCRAMVEWLAKSALSVN